LTAKSAFRRKQKRKRCVEEVKGRCEDKDERKHVEMKCGRWKMKILENSQ
jgi:hypothetical protein